ncbi:hypothetical protein NQZ79_g5047 [Umbelopsis isabellina]|nr:hypothetical protein NQZ79_g5047 [Umbelopsis isabellina]
MSVSLDGDPSTKDVTVASLESNDPLPADSKRYRFPPNEVGIPLTNLQWWLTFLGSRRTIVATAIPKIGSDFNALEQASWIATAYILSFDALQVNLNSCRSTVNDVQILYIDIFPKPMYGKLSDIFGRKNPLLVAVTILGFDQLGICNCISLWAINRKFVNTVMLNYEHVSYSNHELSNRELSQITSAGNGVSAFSHELKTGFLSHLFTILAFFINLPIGGIGCILLVFFFKEHREPTSIRTQMKRIDYLGTTVLLAFATLMLVALNLGGVKYSWSSAPVLSCLFVAIFLIPVLAIIEWKFAKEPMIPLHLFKKRTVTCICLLNVFFGGAWLSVIIELPLFLQAARGDSATMSGVRIIVGQAAITVTSSIGGYLMGRFNSYKPIIILGTGLSSLGIGLLALFTDTSPFGEMYGFMIIAGAGAGMVYACSTVAAQSACEKQELAVVTVLVNFFMNLGSAIGIAVASAIVNNGLQICLADHLSSDLVTSILQSTTFIRSGALSLEQQNVTITCYVSSFRTAWAVMGGFAAIAFVASLFIKHHSLFRDRKDSSKSDESEIIVDETTVNAEK